MDNFRTTILLFFICAINGYAQNNLLNQETRKLNADRVLGAGGGGRMVSLAINPQDENNLFASSDMSSCYISQDGGLSWVQPYRFRNVCEWFFGSDPNTVYAMTVWHTYVSKDKGSSWTPLYPGPTEFARRNSDGFLNTDWADEFNSRPGFRSLVEDTDDPNTLYILTRNGWILRSTDGGTSFSYISRNNLSYNAGSSASYSRFARLAIDPETTVKNRKLTLLALSGVYSFDVATGTWTTLSKLTEYSSGNLQANAVTNAGQIVVDGKTTLLYVQRGSSLTNFETELAVSNNSGATWNVISTNIANAFSPNPTGANAIQIHNFTVVNKNVIYVTAQVSGNLRIIKTTDGGNTWNLLLTSGAYSNISSKILNPGWEERRRGTWWSGLNSYKDLLSQDYNSMASTPANSDKCLTGTWGTVLATNNGGDTWTQLNSDKVSSSVVIPPDSPPSSNNDNGAYQFFKTRGMDQTTTYSYQIDPFNPVHQFICYTDIGLWETYDDGNSYRWADQGIAIGKRNLGNCYDLAFDPNKKNRVYSVWGTNNDMAKGGSSRFYDQAYNNPEKALGGAYYSSDGGYTWTRATLAGTSANGNSITGMGITVDPMSGKDLDNSIVYAAIAGFNDIGGVYRSLDGGLTYNRFSEGIDTRDVFAYSFEWNADASRLYVTFLPVPGGTAYYNAFPGLYNSSNSRMAAAYYLERGSNTWKKVTLPSDVSAVNRFKCDPKNPDIVFMVARHTGVTDQQPSKGGVYVSKDRGNTWTRITPSEINTTALAISTFNTNRIYYSESSSFFNGGMVYYSDKGADTRMSDWKPINFDYQYHNINNIQPDPQDPNAIYICSHGACVWHIMIKKNQSLVKVTDVACPGSNDGKIDIDFPGRDNYTVTVKNKDGFEKTEKITGSTCRLTDLAAGSYEVCYATEGANSQKQCFDVVIAQPRSLNVLKSGIADNKAVYSLTGGTRYTVVNNGQTMEMSGGLVRVPLQKGRNTIRIVAESECQGIFEDIVYFGQNEKVTLFPNPTDGHFSLIIPEKEREVTVEIASLNGHLILTEKRSVLAGNIINMDISAYPKGIYLVMVSGKTFKNTSKVIKK